MVALDVVITACVLVCSAGLAAGACVVFGRVGNWAGPRMLSFAVGVLIGAVLLDLLPHLWESTGDALVLVSLFVSAVAGGALFDRLCLCRHRGAHCAAAHPGHAPPAAGGSALVLVGDFVHSLVDGVLIVAAFAAGTVPGAVATLVVVMHEVPRRMAIATLQLRAGRRPLRALALAAAAGSGNLLGGVCGWHSAAWLEPALPAAMAVSAAALLYVALAQSAQALRAWPARVLVLDGLWPFVAGMLIIGASHQLRELVT